MALARGGGLRKGLFVIRLIYMKIIIMSVASPSQLYMRSAGVI